MLQKPLTGWKRGALNIFIALHLAALLFWGLPDGPFRNRMARPFEKYVVYMGLWHIWGMFAPAPLNAHFDVKALVKYSDGSTAEWIAPRMEDMPVWQRMPKERYRKWRERIRADEFSMIWDDTARYVARLMNKNPQNPPIEVRLSRHWIDFPRPNLKQDYQPMPKGWKTDRSFQYAVIPISNKDLL